MRTSRVVLAAVALACGAAAAAPSLSAQAFAIDKGVWQASGSAGFSSEDPDGARRLITIDLMPRAAYFVARGLAIGATGVYQHTSDGASRSHTLGVGPEVTYYFGRGSRRFYPYVGASVMLDWYQATEPLLFDSSQTFTAKLRIQLYRANAGVAAMVARNVALT